MTRTALVRRLQDAWRLVKAAPSVLSSVSGRGGWWPIVREPFAGAWQRNIEWTAAEVLAYGPVWACVSLIASDISKLPINLVQTTGDDIWTQTENPAFSPVLRKPNRYQTRIKFLESWVLSKLISGNAYILKQRNNRGSAGAGNVTALYVLDPNRCRPMVGEDGSVWYALQADNLSSLRDAIVVPASEIIHDVMVPLHHPLCGVSPIVACGIAALQGMRIQQNSANFFGNGSTPGGILTAPGIIQPEQAKQLKEQWEAEFSGDNAGRVAVLGNGLTYAAMSVKPVDAQLVEQLRWTAENVCTAFHVPPYMIGVGPAPTYNNIEALNAQYYAQCLQNLIENIEILLDEGLEMGTRLGTELDLDGLLRMDTATRMDAAQKAMSAGMSPNEIRKKFHGLGPVVGGDTPYVQQQNFSLAALAKRDAQADPFTSRSTPQPTMTPTDQPVKALTVSEAERFGAYCLKAVLETAA